MCYKARGRDGVLVKLYCSCGSDDFTVSDALLLPDPRKPVGLFDFLKCRSCGLISRTADLLHQDKPCACGAPASAPGK